MRRPYVGAALRQQVISPITAWYETAETLPDLTYHQFVADAADQGRKNLVHQLLG